ncbi:hypothetical protein PROFUN_14708, partial [Planoprotostelium fungivorum]
MSAEEEEQAYVCLSSLVTGVSGHIRASTLTTAGETMSKLLFFAVVAVLAFAALSVTADDEPWWRKPIDAVNDLHPSNATKSEFLRWVKTHAKKYHLSELETRFNLWKKKVHRVWEINNNSTKTWKAGLNHLSAHTKEELKNLLGAISVPPVDNSTKTPVFNKRYAPDWID